MLKRVQHDEENSDNRKRFFVHFLAINVILGFKPKYRFWLNEGISSMVLNRGNAIYRYIILAIAGLTVIAASPSKQGNAQPQSVKAKQSVINKPTSLNLTLPKELAAPTKDQGCKRRRDNPKSDLCAQWKAADAARDAADWAWWQLGLSAVGVLGLGATLWFNFRGLKLAEDASAETRDALAIAERNAEAASSLVKVAEDTAKRQLRAYAKFTMPKDALKLEVGKPIAIDVRMINCGLTPAMNGSFHHSVGIAEPSWKWAKELTTRTVDIAITIHQNEPYRSKMFSNFDITREHADAVFNHGHIIFARGTFYYDDVFGEEHVTQLSIEIGKYELETGQVKIARYGNITT